jgi:retron-type reverse transcriptase
MGFINPLTSKAEIRNKGIPQGGILSPILGNIVLHKLDLYLERFKTKFEKGTRRKDSSEYKKIA